MKPWALALLLVGHAAWADVPADRVQRVDAAGREFARLTTVARACPRHRKCLEPVAKRLQDTLRGLEGVDRDLGLLDREELALRFAWKVEPEVSALVVALAMSGTETADDRAAAQARQAAAQLYAWRDEVRQGKKQDREAVYARIAPLLEKARPGRQASQEARDDFEQTAEAAAWDLRRALYPQRDPHRSEAGRKLEGRLAGILARLETPEAPGALHSRPLPHDLAARELDDLEAELAKAPADLPASERNDLRRRIRRFLEMLPPRCPPEPPEAPERTGDFDKPNPDGSGRLETLPGTVGHGQVDRIGPPRKRCRM